MPFKPVKAFIAVIMALLAVSCGEMVFSPWQSDMPEEATGLIEKKLSRIEALPVADEFKVALMADTHDNYAELADVLRNLGLRNDISFIILLGDSTNSGLKEEYLFLYEELKKTSLPYVSVIASHDTLSNGKDIYKKMFGPFNYSFSFSGTRFIMFNSCKLDFPSDVPDFGWLESELIAAQGSDRIIVFSHVPPVVDKLTGLIESDVARWRSLMETYGADMSVAAHMHLLRVETINGVNYITVPDVEGVRYGILSIRSDGIGYEDCHRLTCETLL